MGGLGRYEEAYKAIKRYIELAPPSHAARIQQAKQALAQLEARFMFGSNIEEKKSQEKSWWKKLFRR